MCELDRECRLEWTMCGLDHMWSGPCMWTMCGLEWTMCGLDHMWTGLCMWTRLDHVWTKSCVKWTQFYVYARMHLPDTLLTGRNVTILDSPDTSQWPRSVADPRPHWPVDPAATAGRGSLKVVDTGQSLSVTGTHLHYTITQQARTNYMSCCIATRSIKPHRNGWHIRDLSIVCFV